ncbi:Microcystin dependent protein [Collimonas arenae]|uniref:Microcystin dependent protein n=1 Tax=Collimonas arenae TaxID=279058 RepID=A0A0A1FD38_9BURK|nr:tail fiber protein [Collimonas arenae]AIY41594.1 Microcystin dependent protein [Collimonas arenae]
MSTPYVGEIRLFAFSRIPTGWLACDGSSQAISTYETLYALIGTTYGGDGQQTFNMPDMRGRVPLHQGTGPGLTTRVQGQVDGVENVTLLSSSMPGHSHPYAATTTLATVTTPASNVQLGAAANSDKTYTNSVSGLTPFVLTPAAISSAGNNLPHDNTMPTLTVSFCIAWAGIFPSQS